MIFDFDFYAGIEKEKLKNQIISMVDNGQSYKGSDIKTIVKEFIGIDLEGWGVSNIITELYRNYVDGIAYFPISDKVYYYLIGKPNEIVVRRDETKSPRRQYK